MPVEDTSSLAPFLLSFGTYILQISAWGEGIAVVPAWHLSSQIMKSALDVACKCSPFEFQNTE